MGTGGDPVGWGRGPMFAAVADTTEAAAGGWAGGLAIIAIGMSEHTVCTALVAHHTSRARNETYLPGTREREELCNCATPFPLLPAYSYSANSYALTTL